MADKKPKAVQVPEGLESIQYDPTDITSLQAARKLLSDKIADLERTEVRAEGRTTVVVEAKP